MLDLVKRAIIGSLWHTIGRRNIIRLSRFLSNHARFDLGNDPLTNGEYDVQRWTLQAFRDTKGSLVVFDVGANVGAWTLSLCGAGPLPVEIHAFEPHPQVAEELRRNMEAWGLAERVTVHPLALSSAPGSAGLFVTPRKSAISSLHPIAEDSGATQVEVTLDTVDGLCAREGIGHIHFLKIDAEGHDLDVLRGGKGMLERQAIDVIQFEYNHRWLSARHFLRDAFDLLGPLAYTVGKISPRGIEFALWHHEMELFRESNWLAVRPGLADRFPQVKWWKEPR